MLGMIHCLYAHRQIAVDFDGTLIDHPNSFLLQDFVLRERDRRRFWIITHRSGGTSRRLWRHLYHASFGRLGKADFAGVRHLPLEVYDAWCRGQAGEASKSDYPPERQFIEWKARTARELACTVLVDDMAQNGEVCQSFGIRYIATAWL